MVFKGFYRHLIKYVFLLVGLMVPEPEFVEPLQNVTATAGRDIKLQCSVKHLGSYKVFLVLFVSSRLIIFFSINKQEVIANSQTKVLSTLDL